MTDVFSDRFAAAIAEGVHPLDVITGTNASETLDGTTGDDEIRGKDGDDLLHGHEGDDALYGGDGADTLLGSVGDDTLRGGLGNDVIAAADRFIDATGNESIDGGDGDDRIYGSMGLDQLDGGAGSDQISIFGDSDTVHGGDGDDFLFGDATLRAVSSDVLVYGDGGDDTVILFGSNAKGAAGSTIHGGDGADRITYFEDHRSHASSAFTGDEGNDTIRAQGAGDDIIDGGAGLDVANYVGRKHAITLDLASGTADGKSIGHDSLIGMEAFVGGIADDVATGSEAADSLAGKNGLDLLTGAGGDDTLVGGGLSDTIIGGLGADSMSGGGGADTFVYNSVTESTDAGRDTIDHLKKHDVIDLSAIDADVNTAGDQAFTKVAAFDGQAGQMTLTFTGGLTLLQVDVDGDASPDMSIELTGQVTGHKDFVL